jgi:hypothetical protein
MPHRYCVAGKAVERQIDSRFVSLALKLRLESLSDYALP